MHYHVQTINLMYNQAASAAASHICTKRSDSTCKKKQESQSVFILRALSSSEQKKKKKKNLRTWKGFFFWQIINYSEKNLWISSIGRELEGGKSVLEVSVSFL